MTALQTIINQVADEADDLLGGINSVDEARVELQDHLKTSYPKLSAAESKAALAGVLAILKEEGFFDSSRSGDGLDAGDTDGLAEQE